MLYGWGMPALIVAICSIVEFATTIEFGYERYPDSPAICWISQPISNLIAFGIPLAIILSVNAVLFTLTIIKLNEASSQIKRHKSTIRKATPSSSQ